VAVSRLAVLALSGLLITQDARAANIEWSRDFSRMFAEAAERGRPVLIDFRGGSCGGRSAPGALETRAGTGLAGGMSRPVQQTDLNDCDLMQQEVWGAPRIAAAAERFLPVLVDGGDQTLNVQYQVVATPTTLIADPWGNEVLRVVGYLEPAKMERVLAAVPKDFTALAPFAKTLREDGTDPRALAGAAGFYEGQGLRQVGERLYEKALSAPTMAADVAARRQLTISRGLNLLMMNRDKEAASVFEKEIGQAAQGPGTDALYLGLVNAHLQGGRRKDAEKAVQALERAFPDSPYTARAKQNLAGVGK